MFHTDGCSDKDKEICVLWLLLVHIGCNRDLDTIDLIWRFDFRPQLNFAAASAAPKK